MCGLIGVAGKITIKEEKLFKQGLIVDSLRGEHSTGVAAVYKGKSAPVIAKQVGGPIELFNDKRFDDAMRYGVRALIGHNRYATMGAVSRHNAHPFNFDHIYGAHNGTLSNWSDLDGWREFTVDSQGLYHHIANNSLEDAISKVTGAWALTWWDEKTQELNFLRNEQRPLFYATDEKNELLFWASEWEMLQLLLNRNNIKYQKILELPVNQWIRWPIDQTGAIGKPKTKKVEGKKITTAHSTTTNGGSNKQTSGQGKTYEYNSTVLRKGVVLEVQGHKLDSRRAGYLLVTDAENQKSSIRLYTKQGDEFKWKKDHILVGDIVSFTTDEGGYYKVLYSSVRDGTIEEQVRFDEKMGRFDNKKENVVDTFLDHKGKYLSKADWEKKYPYCSWCNIDLNAEEDNLLSVDGDALCPDCSKDQEIVQYV